MGASSPVVHGGHASLGSLALTQEHGEAQPAQRGHARAPAGVEDGVGSTWGQWGRHLGCHECCQGGPPVSSLTVGAHDEGMRCCAVRRAQQQGFKGLGTCAREVVPLSTHYPRHQAPCPPPAPKGPQHPGGTQVRWGPPGAHRVRRGSARCRVDGLSGSSR